MVLAARCSMSSAKTSNLRPAITSEESSIRPARSLHSLMNCWSFPEFSAPRCLLSAWTFPRSPQLSRLRSAEPDRKTEVTIAPGLQAQGDERLITILLQRLLDNAWKFTSKTERPRISFGPCAEHDGAFVIRDNGAGFNPAGQPRLFKIFQRLHSHAEFPGIGAGLAIARTIVQRHGGTIWAESGDAPGAKFFFTLT